ncbi:sn-glycerol-3-phosphate ABC transporter ATP-binding protein UgpC [Sansalvadorimonas verongulae]|uniref:sn-glycerol-3-phosphate ABC transporter ATP-binding protein UgpC n=1 Tax=Sansalvadorimonas verongulae TaxID=2172824 RepID=UPI0012BC09B9|nr:sn-glycerol-3-phosphate ABC transporter ATP-binding protein UgpC [Sansalvadorimonas verongulae]MTI14467.1 sn-glycerol-3-phosphate ABC transporter ATP-binding protein UgpC [Sansalvadorimonas verongulae]
MAQVSFHQLAKTYDNGFQAIHGIDLEINDGEFVVIVGPSGCGKSTLLRMVAGLEEITSGKLLIDETFVNEREPAERDIAMVFQNYALYPHMTVFNNMAYGLKNRKVPKDKIASKVQQAAEVLQLTHLLDRKPGQLSGGQRQRVAMGRAIVRDPKLFLFDEPLSNLDAKLRGQMRIEIKKLQRQLGTTALYVTHDQIEAMTLADRLVVMDNGHPEQTGTPEELYSRPATRFVAGFLGTPSINFLDVQLTATGAQLSNGEHIKIAGVSDSRTITLGLRAEDLTCSTPAQADFTMSVELVEQLGSELQAVGVLQGTTEKLIVKLNKSEHLEEGMTLPLKINRNHWHWFDADTGQRVDSLFTTQNAPQQAIAV